MRENQLEFNYNKIIGSVQQVLIENYEDELIFGHTKNYVPVRISGIPNDINEIISVKLVQIKEGEMFGERQV